MIGAGDLFRRRGRRRIRVQPREDGLGIDQIVLSPARYLSAAPGTLKNDETVVDGSGQPAPPPGASIDEIALHATDATLLAGAWTRTADTTAASGVRRKSQRRCGESDDRASESRALRRADVPRRRGQRATGCGFAARRRRTGGPTIRCTSSSATRSPTLAPPSTASARRPGAEINLEDCSGCGLSGWGWQDNGYGVDLLGADIRFATGGLHTIRVQVREDGIGIDQIVLSASRYFRLPPGTLKNDGTILTKSRL